MLCQAGSAEPVSLAENFSESLCAFLVILVDFSPGEYVYIFVFGASLANISFGGRWDGGTCKRCLLRKWKGRT